MSNVLPDSFQLPSPEQYEACIEELQEEAAREGSMHLLLSRYCTRRKSSYDFTCDVRYPLANIALDLEVKDEQHALAIQKDLPTAKAAFGGMIIGHMMKERLYQNADPILLMYNEFQIHGDKLGAYQTSFEEAEDDHDIWMIGTQAMASYVLNPLNSKALSTLNDWTIDVVPKEAFQRFFQQGLGMSLFMAIDTYDELMPDIEEE